MTWSRLFGARIRSLAISRLIVSSNAIVYEFATD
jgi:hypothetical protein